MDVLRRVNPWRGVWTVRRVLLNVAQWIVLALGVGPFIQDGWSWRTVVMAVAGFWGAGRLDDMEDPYRELD